MTNAVQAGYADPRFPHLSEAELDGLEIDVSILSHPRSIPAASEAELVAGLEPDRDGLILGAGRRRALFLPSVWRQVADPREFVRHLMIKAGLDSMIFPRGLEAQRFRVESFGAPWRRRSRRRDRAGPDRGCGVGCTEQRGDRCNRGRHRRLDLDRNTPNPKSDTPLAAALSPAEYTVRGEARPSEAAREDTLPHRARGINRRGSTFLLQRSARSSNRERPPPKGGDFGLRIKAELGRLRGPTRQRARRL